jgi:2-polyprenyl-3-methyl-5-hydroxy-6-metoxy-1,4-benzoquinol methylase
MLAVAASSSWNLPSELKIGPERSTIVCDGWIESSPMARRSSLRGEGKPTDPEQPASPAATTTYDRHYFDHYCDATKTGKLAYERNEHWLRFFGTIADHIVSDIKPRTVLDAGCAMGFLVEALRDRGVEAFGVDISEYAIAQVRSDIKPYCRQGSITDPLSDRYDLIVSIEVLEHLPTEEAILAVGNLCAATDDFMFSSTPNDYQEITHLNVQQPEWWTEVFARQGFFRDVDYDPSTYLSPWAVRYRRSTDTVARTVGGYERLAWRLKNENQALRQSAHAQRDRFAQMELELAAIKQSGSWRALSAPKQITKRLFPVDTPRGRWLRQLVKRPR